jgi:hypothetical protein
MENNVFYSLSSSIGSDFSSGLSSMFSCFGRVSLSAFLDFFIKKIPHAAITKQHIQTIGLATNQAIHIVTNHTTIVNPKAIIPVHTQIMFARKGRTFAKVSMNLNIAANPQYINSSQINLNIQVICLFACCACKNISSAVTFHCSSKEMVLQLETV